MSQEVIETTVRFHSSQTLLLTSTQAFCKTYKCTQERSKLSSSLLKPQPGHCDDADYSEYHVVVSRDTVVCTLVKTLRIQYFLLALFPFWGRWKFGTLSGVTLAAFHFFRASSCGAHFWDKRDIMFDIPSRASMLSWSFLCWCSSCRLWRKATSLRANGSH